MAGAAEHDKACTASNAREVKISSAACANRTLPDFISSTIMPRAAIMAVPSPQLSASYEINNNRISISEIEKSSEIFRAALLEADTRHYDLMSAGINF